MEVDEKPTEDYNDIGGLDKQIEELVEAVVLPMTHADRFKNLGIKPPKGADLFRNFFFLWNEMGMQAGIVPRLESDHHTRFPSFSAVFFFNFFFLCRCSYVWTSWYWKDAPCACMCRPDQFYFPQACRSTACAGKLAFPFAGLWWRGRAYGGGGF
jgi:hypothetical protein